MLMRFASGVAVFGMILVGCSDLGSPPVDPVPTLTVVGGTVTEGDPAICLVQLNAVPTKPVTFTYTTVGETAIDGADFQPISGTGTIDPADGEDHFHLHILTLQDTLAEPPKSFRMVVSSVVGADVISDTAQCVILDDDGQPSLTVQDAPAVEGETVTFAVAINVVAKSLVIFSYATADSSAVAGSDYTSEIGTDTIPVGQTSVIISVPTTNDSTFEPIEAFKFAISGVTGAQMFDSIAIGTIEDNDPAPISFSADIQPLLNNRCTSCHAGAGAEKGYRIDSYTNVINSGENSPQVIPGNSAASRLYNVVAWTSGYPRMPQSGSQLSASEIKKIKDWIDRGAPDN